MKKAVSIVMILCFWLSGCASIVSKSTYPVVINSSPNQSKITITDERGLKVYAGETPTTITLRAGEAYFHGKDYTITFEKEGYHKQVFPLRSELDAWYIGNILIGGLIGWLIVDPLTGAMWRLSPSVNVTLDKKDTSAKGYNQLNIVMLDDVPKHLRSSMVRIK